MERPTRFEHNRYVGDKRKQVVYDLDNTDDVVEAAVAELMAAETFICFGPDTLAEARNRGYRLARSSRGGPQRRRRRRRQRRGLTTDGRRRRRGRTHPLRRAAASTPTWPARPGRPSGPLPAVVLCHGYPSTGTAATAPETMPELADRIATEMGWAALAFAYRGCGGSDGQFSLGGWLDDIASAVAHVEAAVRPLGIWLAGFGTGGSLAVCAAAADPRVQGVAALGAPGRLRRLGVAPPPPARARAGGGRDHRPRVPAVARRLVARAQGRSAPSPASPRTRPARCW